MKLDKRSVKGWLQGQKRASSQIARERVLSLSSLTVEESAATYQSLTATLYNESQRPKPSPVLWQMRKAMSRYAKYSRKRSA